LAEAKTIGFHVTFREILKGINFDDVLNGFNKWASEYVAIESKEWVSIDGKALVQQLPNMIHLIKTLCRL
jgi:hypothetical protein